MNTQSEISVFLHSISRIGCQQVHREPAAPILPISLRQPRLKAGRFHTRQCTYVATTHISQAELSRKHRRSLPIQQSRTLAQVGGVRRGPSPITAYIRLLLQKCRYRPYHALALALARRSLCEAPYCPTTTSRRRRNVPLRAFQLRSRTRRTSSTKVTPDPLPGIPCPCTLPLPATPPPPLTTLSLSLSRSLFISLSTPNPAGQLPSGQLPGVLMGKVRSAPGPQAGGHLGDRSLQERLGSKQPKPALHCTAKPIHSMFLLFAGPGLFTSW
jgi:hypothetical protein